MNAHTAIAGKDSEGTLCLQMLMKQMNTRRLMQILCTISLDTHSERACKTLKVKKYVFF